jgi:hypothetical protein
MTTGAIVLDQAIRKLQTNSTNIHSKY